MNPRILFLPIIALIFSGLVQAQLLEPRPDQNMPEPVSADPSFGLLGSERQETIREDVVLRGHITAYDFAQPETLITLESNRQSWQLLAPSSVELRRLGWDSNSLFVGEMVEVLAAREPGRNIALAKRITRANGALLLTGLQQQNTSSSFSDVPDGMYSLDTSQAHLFFRFNHLGFSQTPVKVERLSGSVHWNRANPAASIIQMDLDVSSFRSGVSALDEALRGPDFFDSLNNPRIRFNSTSLSVSSWGSLTINGQLEIMGISKPVSLEAKINQVGRNPLTEKFTLGISAEGKISRSAWDMTDYLPMIEDAVSIQFEGEFILSGNQGGSRTQGLSPNSTLSPTGQSTEFGPTPATGTSGVSTSPSQNPGFIFSQ